MCVALNLGTCAISRLRDAIQDLHVPYRLCNALKVLCDGSRMCTTIHYVVIKPDSRPDGTAIRDHVRVHILPPEKDVPQTASPSEILPAASRCSSFSAVPR